MPPPPKGTKAYENYLKRQADRKRNLRDRIAARDLQQRAQPLIEEAVREARLGLEASLQQQVQRKNQFMRANRAMKVTNEKLLESNVKQSVEIKQLKKQLQRSRSQAKESQEEADAANKAAKALQREDTSWQVWYDRLQMRASEGEMENIHHLARRPPRARDRMWGGFN